MPADETTCDRCRAVLAADQRYCLECGERHGPQRLDALAMARPPAAGAPAEAPAAATAPGEAVRLPGPRTAALLTLAMLVAGVALGAASGDRTAASVAATGRRVVLVGGPPALGAMPASPAAVAARTAGDASPTEATADVATPDPVAAPTVDVPAVVDPAPVDPGTDTSSDTDPVTAPEPTPIPTAPPALPPVKHVWLVSLADRKLADTFGPASPDPWFREVLVRQGALLNNYHATSLGAPADAIALLSGQGANPATEGDCAKPADVDPGTTAGDFQQVKGTGCVYPGTVTTLPEQLTGAGLTWKAYVEDVAPGGLSATPSCEGTRTPRNPFAYFKALTADAQCPQRIVGTDAIAADLADPARTPSFSYVVPNACHAGSDVPCAPGAAAGLGATSAWLQPLLEQIRASAAYQDDGLVVVVGDRSGPDGPGADSSVRRGSDAPAGGGLVPALLLSKWITPGEQVATGYDHMALLRSLEDLFGLPRLGLAAAPGLKGFGPKVFGAWTPPTGR